MSNNTISNTTDESLEKKIDDPEAVNAYMVSARLEKKINDLGIEIDANLVERLVNRVEKDAKTIAEKRREFLELMDILNF